MSLIFKYVSILLFLLFSLPASACFGPKLYIGTATGVDAELLFHLVSIYVQEKTGVESLRVELGHEQTIEGLLQQEKIDLGISVATSATWSHLLAVGDGFFLLNGPRPTNDLQFTTVPKALQRLQLKLQPGDLVSLRQQVSAGMLPAKAVRAFYMQRGWI